MPAAHFLPSANARDQGLSLRDGLVVMLVLVSTVAGILVSLPGPDLQERPIALVFAPWVSGEEAVARSLAAGHPILRRGASSFIVIAAPPSSRAVKPARPDGAWLMLTLAGLAGCLDTGTSGDMSS